MKNSTKSLKSLILKLYRYGWKFLRNCYVSIRYRSYWQSLRGKYRGQRGWVIGNGPSLSVEDLDKLKGEITIASNKIYLAFEETDWRPSFVTCCDTVLWKKIKRECTKNYPRIHLSSLLINPLTDLFSRKRIFFKTLSPVKLDPSLGCSFSDNVVKGMHNGYSITYENIQFAHHLGLNPIYIIGCDHYYGGEENMAGKDLVAGKAQVEAKEINHFHPDYRKKGEVVSPAFIDGMNAAYAQAQAFATKNNITIINATRGGHLEAFKRCDFDQIIRQK